VFLFLSRNKNFVGKSGRISYFLLKVVKNLDSERINITTTGKLQMFLALSKSIDN